jgi:hypothetical protein
VKTIEFEEFQTIKEELNLEIMRRLEELDVKITSPKDRIEGI